MAVPGSSTRVVSDLIPEVTDALGGRTDVSTLQASRAIKRALEELTESNVFEELRHTGPQVSLTPGVSIYPVSTFLNPGVDYTSPEVFVIFVDYPTNSIVGEVKYKTPKAIESMITPGVTGLPSRFTRYGVNFHFGPTPALPYTVYLRYQTKHPFPDDQTALGGQRLHIPSSWEEIVAYSAALRIAIAKRWPDQQKLLHDLLFGDPEFLRTQGKSGRPGLIAARSLQVERDQKFDNRSLTPVVGRYSSR